MRIINIETLEILDSRGNPTLEVSVILNDGSKGVFKVPSGASTGIHEAHELRDNNKNIYHGKGVTKAMKNIEKIKNKLFDVNFTQKELDEKLIEIDGTENKELIGANAILGISIAFAKASAKYYNLPLYEYLYREINNIDFDSKNKLNLKKINVNLFANVINGGLHSGNNLNIQEFMIIPKFNSINKSIRAISEVYQKLKELIGEKYGKENTAVGDEGGFAPNISKPTEALKLIQLAIKEMNYEGDFFIALDAAASDFYNKDTKKYEVEKGILLEYKDLTNYYNKLIEEFPIISIEDPMEEDDFIGFNYFMKNISKLKTKNFLTSNKNVLCVGDDLLVTNPKRINIAINKKLANSLLLKINQIGTLTESLNAAKMAKKEGWKVIVSHRSGETIDSFISDLAVALNSSIKLGSPARGERVAKYNRLLNIFNEN